MNMKLKYHLRKIYLLLKDCKEKRQLSRRFYKQYDQYNSMAPNDRKAEKKFLYPCLYDSTSETEIEPTYFYQDSWAFERIYSQRPEKHIDIGSSHKLVSFLSKVTHLTMVDIRPLSLKIDSINFQKGDILNLPFKDGTISSLSSICVIEHIGLGRYGDSIDPLGSEKAIREIDRILSINAQLYISVPIEENNKVYFNAHRAFNEDYLLEELFDGYKVLDTKYIYGNDFGAKKEPGFGTGCYHLQKVSNK